MQKVPLKPQEILEKGKLEGEGGGKNLILNLIGVKECVRILCQRGGCAVITAGLSDTGSVHCHFPPVLQTRVSLRDWIIFHHQRSQSARMAIGL